MSAYLQQCQGKYPSKMALGQAFGISRQAVYRYLKAGE